MHFDGGFDRRAQFFGAIETDHTVPLSVLIPMTGPVKLRVCHALTRALRDGTFYDIPEQERHALIAEQSETLTIELGEMLVCIRPCPCD
jgi:hypothetical protein